MRYADLIIVSTSKSNEKADNELANSLTVQWYTRREVNACRRATQAEIDLELARRRTEIDNLTAYAAGKPDGHVSRLELEILLALWTYDSQQLIVPSHVALTGNRLLTAMPVAGVERMKLIRKASTTICNVPLDPDSRGNPTWGHATTDILDVDLWFLERSEHAIVVDHMRGAQLGRISDAEVDTAERAYPQIDPDNVPTNVQLIAVYGITKHKAQNVQRILKAHIVLQEIGESVFSLVQQHERNQEHIKSKEFELVDTCIDPTKFRDSGVIDAINRAHAASYAEYRLEKPEAKPVSPQELHTILTATTGKIKETRIKDMLKALSGNTTGDRVMVATLTACLTAMVGGTGVEYVQGLPEISDQGRDLTKHQQNNSECHDEIKQQGIVIEALKQQLQEQRDMVATLQEDITALTTPVVPMGQPAMAAS